MASSLVIPGVAAAHTSEAIAESGGLALNLPGVAVNFEVMLDELGNIEAVNVIDPAVPEPTPDQDGPHRVRFELADDGTRIGGNAKKHKLSSKVSEVGGIGVAGDRRLPVLDRCRFSPLPAPPE